MNKNEYENGPERWPQPKLLPMPGLGPRDPNRSTLPHKTNNKLHNVWCTLYMFEQLTGRTAEACNCWL